MNLTWFTFETCVARTCLLVAGKYSTGSVGVLSVESTRLWVTCARSQYQQSVPSFGAPSMIFVKQEAGYGIGRQAKRVGSNRRTDVDGEDVSQYPSLDHETMPRVMKTNVAMQGAEVWQASDPAVSVVPCGVWKEKRREKSDVTHAFC